MTIALALICLTLSVCLGFTMRRVSKQQAAIYALEQDNRRIWQYLQRKNPIAEAGKETLNG